MGWQGRDVLIVMATLDRCGRSDPASRQQLGMHHRQQGTPLATAATASRPTSPLTPSTTPPHLLVSNAAMVQVDALQRSIHCRGQLLATQVLQAAVEVQVLPCGQPVPQQVVLQRAVVGGGCISAAVETCTPCARGATAPLWQARALRWRL